MANGIEVFAFKRLIDEVEELIGVRFEVIGKGKERELRIPAEPQRRFSARGRRECVRYLQGMIWAGQRKHKRW